MRAINGESKANSGEQEEERNTETTLLGQNATNNFSRIWASSIKFDMNKASQTREFQSLEMREKFGQVFSCQKPKKDQSTNI